MKPAALALLLLVCAASSRADESAYGSLIGMAASAKSDRGPDAGEIPPDLPRRPQPPARASSAFVSSARAASAWTRLFSSLTPSWKAAPSLSYEVCSSTRVPRGAPEGSRSAAEMGEVRGLAEYLAMAVAPTASLAPRPR